jgi:transposase-like protein
MNTQQVADHQACPHCGSHHTHWAGKVGGRSLWRCPHCARTFWPRKKDSGVLRGLKNLFLGAHS